VVSAALFYWCSVGDSNRQDVLLIVVAPRFDLYLWTISGSTLTSGPTLITQTHPFGFRLPGPQRPGGQTISYQAVSFSP
jgi:hypothetical protein